MTVEVTQDIYDLLAGMAASAQSGIDQMNTNIATLNAAILVQEALRDGINEILADLTIEGA